MKTYSVSHLANLAGVSVRTLHYYDQIGLLKPTGHTKSGYRLYGEDELIQLQQILFFRELDFPLKEIQLILDNPEFDPVQALETHRKLIQQRAKRLDKLINTIDKTIEMLRKDGTPLKEEELYQGFSKEKIERYQREVNEKYDPELVAESQRRLKKMSKEQWQEIQAEGECINQGLSKLLDRDPSDPEVQTWIARHHTWIENYYPASAEVYAGLGRLYVENLEFRAFYDKYQPGLADFLSEAMSIYAREALT